MFPVANLRLMPTNVNNAPNFKFLSADSIIVIQNTPCKNIYKDNTTRTIIIYKLFIYNKHSL